MHSILLEYLNFQNARHVLAFASTALARPRRGKKSIKIHLVGASVNERGPLATPFEINWHFQKTLHAPLHALFPGVPRFTRVYAHDAPLLPSPSTLLSSFSAAINGQKRLDAEILCFSFLSWKQLGQIFWLARIHWCVTQQSS